MQSFHRVHCYTPNWIMGKTKATTECRSVTVCYKRTVAHYRQKTTTTQKTEATKQQQQQQTSTTLQSKLPRHKIQVEGRVKLQGRGHYYRKISSPFSRLCFFLLTLVHTISYSIGKRDEEVKPSGGRIKEGVCEEDRCTRCYRKPVSEWELQSHFAQNEKWVFMLHQTSQNHKLSVYFNMYNQRKNASWMWFSVSAVWRKWTQLNSSIPDNSPTLTLNKIKCHYSQMCHISSLTFALSLTFMCLSTSALSFALGEHWSWVWVRKPGAEAQMVF